MTHQLPQFAAELQALRQRLLDMGAAAESVLGQALTGLLDGNPNSLDQVMDGGRAARQIHVAIDEQCLHMLALYQPVASDLRVVVATLRISAHLDRTCGLAVNIAQAGQRYLQHRPVKPLIDVPRMGQLALTMLRQSLAAFTTGHVGLAGDALRHDDWLQTLKEQILRELLTYMMSEPRTVEPSAHLLLIAQQLERVGDHATSIADDVIFMVEGRDIRHRTHGVPPVGLQERRSNTIAPPI